MASSVAVLQRGATRKRNSAAQVLPEAMEPWCLLLNQVTGVDEPTNKDMRPVRNTKFSGHGHCENGSTKRWIKSLG